MVRHYLDFSGKEQAEGQGNASSTFLPHLSSAASAPRELYYFSSFLRTVAPGRTVVPLRGRLRVPRSERTKMEEDAQRLPRGAVPPTKVFPTVCDGV